MDLDEFPWEHDNFFGVTRALRGLHTLTFLTEVSPMIASTAINGCDVNCTCRVCLTEGPACACTAGHLVTVDKIGRAVFVFLFEKAKKGHWHSNIVR